MSFSGEKTVKATRKRHQCCACLSMIEIGESAVNWAGMNDGDFNSVYYHPECRAAEIAYNHMIAVWHADEWASLAEIESDDLIWLEAEHPAAFSRRRNIMTKKHARMADRGRG